MSRIRVAIAGVGNCASALVQGVTWYGLHPQAAGLQHPTLGPYSVSDLQFVAAFDIDARKVGRPLEEAVFAPPNCTPVFQDALPSSGVTVEMGPVLDGVAAHLEAYPEAARIRPDGRTPADTAAVLRAAAAEVLVTYLPVGAQQAVCHYAEACLDAGVALVNCVPVFIASDPTWAARFTSAGLPLLGDDIKSQLGATIVHRALARLFGDRGVRLARTYQINTGGNTDFLNMLERDRLHSKRVSKTEAVRSQLDVPLADDDVHIGPSDYVPWQKDNKIAFVRLEGAGFAGFPVELELRLSVLDSPNSAGVVVDAVRCARLARDRGLGGPVLGPCAAYMKRPPRQMGDVEAMAAVEAFIAG